jgi:REP element-mobilizing transposase RayT
MPYNPNVHHRRSIRLPGYDYSQAGSYFMTIVAWQRECLFGAVTDGQVRLSRAGQLVEDVWKTLPARYPGIALDSFCVMPNHVHGILNITDAVEAVHEPLRLRTDRRSMLLPKAIGYLKMNSAKQINLLLSRTGAPVWQRNYYEHVIRNDADLRQIREYLANNPARCEFDKLHPFLNK